MSSERVCRTCLQSDLLLFPLIESVLSQEGAEVITVGDFLQSFTSISISNNEYPKNICYTCFNETKRAFAFKMKCEKSEATFQCLNLEIKAKLPVVKEGEMFVNIEDFIPIESYIKDEDIKNEIVDDFGSTYLETYENSAKNKISLKCEESLELMTVQIKDEEEASDTNEDVKIDISIKDGTTTSRAVKSHKIEITPAKKSRNKKTCEDLLERNELSPVSSSEISENGTKDIITKENNERPYKCPTCIKSFKSLNSFITHKEFGHTVYSCQYCTIKFRDKNKYRKHVLEHEVFFCVFD